jgi:hypothetical protein
VLKKLMARNIRRLYHANSVETALTYINENALLSREIVVNRGLPQSGQFTDDKDISYGIFGDVFFNLDDQHQRFRRPNSYGPILFRINVGSLFSLIYQNSEAKVNITKRQPHEWESDDKPEMRWLQEISEMDGLFMHPESDPSKRSWRADGNWSDFVVSGFSDGVPLGAVEAILVENIPSIPQLFDEFLECAENLTADRTLLGRIYRRDTCPATCRCSNESSYRKVLADGKGSFGVWKKTSRPSTG